MVKDNNFKALGETLCQHGECIEERFEKYMGIFSTGVHFRQTERLSPIELSSKSLALLSTFVDLGPK